MRRANRRPPTFQAICLTCRETSFSLSDVGSQPGAGEVELLVLASVAPDGDTTATLAQRIGQPPETVHAALVELVQAGLVEATEGSVMLTETGRLAASEIRRSSPTAATGTPVPTMDLGEVARFIGSLWPPSDPGRVAAQETARAGLLASDADRDHVAQLLSEAFAQGRLSSSEFEDRTSRALSARTYGDLDDVLQGLGGLPRPARSHPVRKAVFWVVALLSSPFLLVGSMFTSFGEDAGDRVFGVVCLVLLLPGLLALRRWAWPRS